MRSRTKRSLFIGGVVVASVPLLGTSLTTPTPSATDDSARTVTYIAPVDDDALVQQSMGLRSSPEPGEEATLVSFEVNSSNMITGKSISLERTPLDTTEKRNALAQYTADNSGHVELSWWDPSEGSINWTVERDGILATVSGSSFSDARPDPSISTTYRITGQREITINGSPSGEVAIEPFTSVIQVPGVDADPVGQRLGEAALDANSNTDVLTLQGGWTLQNELNTFIPTAIASTPFDLQPCIEAYGGNGVGYYAGDDRSFAGPTDYQPSSRTSMYLSLSFDALGHTDSFFQMIKRTSGTRLYDSTGTLIAEADADLDITAVGGMGDITGAQGTYRHHVADPLCSVAPAIDYELTIGGWGNGQVRLFGMHDQAPSYEWRVSGPTPGYFNFYEFESKGLQYLAPPFPNAHVDIVGAV